MKFSAQIQLFSKVSFVDKLLFTKHLSIMLKSGITIVEALDILASQAKATAFKKVLVAIVDDIKNGKSLAEALSRHPTVFNSFYTNLIKIGEVSGILDQTLIYLSQQLAKEYTFRKKIQGAMLYPTIVFVAAAIVGIGISIFVLPQLIELFEGFDAKLPLTTQILLFIAALMRDYGIVVVIALVLFILGLRMLITLPVIKPLWHNFLLSLPIFGKILQDGELTSMCRNLGIMLKSGLTITAAIDVEANITTNLVFKKYLVNILAAIDKGKSLSTEIESGHYPKIPLIVTKMIAVGEKTGKLEETFIYLGDFFEDEVDDATRNISTIIEPIMLLIIGVIVAFVALAIISPIYELTSSVKR